MSADRIGCAAGCKRDVADQDEALAAGWDNLPISSRWRCPDCTRELVAAREFPGVDIDRCHRVALEKKGSPQ